MRPGILGLLLGLLWHKVAGESLFRSVVVMEDALERFAILVARV
jgi:hypothetical protein